MYCAGKTADQVRAVAAALRGVDGVTTLFARATPDHAATVKAEPPEACFNESARFLAWPPEPLRATGGLVVITAAGTSDLPPADHFSCNSQLRSESLPDASSMKDIA